MKCLACQDTGFLKIRYGTEVRQMRCIVCGKEQNYIWVLMQIGAEPVVYYAVFQLNKPEDPTNIVVKKDHKLVWAKVTIKR